MEKTLHSEILALQEANGHLDPDVLWQTAKKRPGTALYKRFEAACGWDEQKSAQAHWRSIACGLIREFKLVIKVEKIGELDVKRYVRDPVIKSGYRNTQVVRNSPEMALASLIDRFKQTRGRLQNDINLALYWSADADDPNEALESLNRFIKNLEEAPELIMKNPPKPPKTPKTPKGDQPTA